MSLTIKKVPKVLFIIILFTLLFCLHVVKFDSLFPYDSYKENLCYPKIRKNIHTSIFSS